MSRYCGTKTGSSRNSRAKIAGIALMIVGVLLILLFVPCWAWTSVLGIALISVGFLIWRFLG